MNFKKNGVASKSRLIELSVVAFFCAVFATLALSFLNSACSTSDETIYLPAGYTYLKWHDYRINTEHPPLVKKLAALPLLIQSVWPTEIEPKADDFSASRFVTSERLLRLSWAIALKYPNSQWNFCHQFLYGVKEEAQRRFGAETPLLVPTTISLTAADFQNDADHLLLCERVIVLLLAVALAIVVYLWARALHGVMAAAVFALALLVFDPNFIAHGGLVATDVPLALFMTGSIYFYWRLFRRVEVISVLLFLLFFACAFVTKFSAVALLPIYWLIAAGRISNPTPWLTTGRAGRFFGDSHSGKTSFLLLLFAGAVVVTWATIWCFYDFRYSAARNPAQVAQEEQKAGSVFPKLVDVAFREPGYHPIEEEVRRASTIRSLLKERSENEVSEELIKERIKTTPVGYSGRLILFANRHHLLPEAYLGGFATADVASLLRHSYLRGQYSSGGFRTYFVWTFLLKTPLPAIVAILAGLYFAIARKMPWNSDLSFLVIPVAVYFAFATMSNMNIGHRHLLPIYPFLYVLAGSAGRKLAEIGLPAVRWSCQAGAVAALGVSSSVVFAPPSFPQLVFPHYLAYFNELAGGPLNGWRSLVDSNIDWGQDLKGLKSWVETAQLKEPIYLCYFGTADPRYYGIRHKPVPKALGGYPATPDKFGSKDPVSDFVNALQPGDYIAVSVQNVIGPALTERAHEVWQRILDRSTIVDRIGYSILILKLESQP